MGLSLQSTVLTDFRDQDGLGLGRKVTVLSPFWGDWDGTCWHGGWTCLALCPSSLHPCAGGTQKKA